MPQCSIAAPTGRDNAAPSWRAMMVYGLSVFDCLSASFKACQCMGAVVNVSNDPWQVLNQHCIAREDIVNAA
jgi:hypothetical protein